jgi:HSP20 family protein
MLGSLVLRSWFREMPRSLFHDLSDLDSFFDSAFGRRTEEGSAWWPLVESYTKDGQLILRCDLPGVDPKDVDVSLEGNVLTIRGERRAEHEGDAYREVRYGRFERTLTMPEGLDPEKIKARYVNGVLEVTVPAPAATTRKVPIEIEQHEASSKRAA